MTGNQSCKVLVVGAGPAGASLACFLAVKGVDTVLIDKKSEIDRPVRCAEYIPANLVNLFEMHISGIELKTEEMITYIDYAESNTVKAPGLMLDRKTFTRSLAEDFIKKGGTFLRRSKAISFTEKAGSIKAAVDCGGNKISITTQIVAGADGPNSIVGRYMDSKNSSYILGLNENIPAEATDKSKTLVFFSPDIPGGYGWLFPREKSINLGIGCETPHDRILESLDLKGIYRAFKNNVLSMDLIKTGGPGHTIPEGKITAGLIPSSGLIRNPVKDRFVLTGDAAGLSNAVTGAGIYNAVLSAHITSGVVLKALEKKDIGFLRNIEEEYENSFSMSLERAAARREEFLTRWPEGVRSEEDFKKLVMDCWVSYKEYWKK